MPRGWSFEYGDLRMREEWLKEYIEQKKRKAKAIRENANLGKRFESRTFETFDESVQQMPYEICKRYAVNFPKNKGKDINSIVLQGDCGTGKTHLVAAITNYVIDEFGVSCLFDTWSNHLVKIKNEFNGKAEYIEALCSIPLLVIDDYGQEKRTEWSDEMLYKVVNSRYERLLPILMTTNIPDLKNGVKSQILSRLVEMSAVVKMTGTDWRMKK